MEKQHVCYARWMTVIKTVKTPLTVHVSPQTRHVAVYNSKLSVILCSQINFDTFPFKMHLRWSCKMHYKCICGDILLFVVFPPPLLWVLIWKLFIVVVICRVLLKDASVTSCLPRNALPEILLCPPKMSPDVSLEQDSSKSDVYI